jgi:hypothetical protein
MASSSHSEFRQVRDAFEWARDGHDYGGTENPLAYVAEAVAALRRIEEQYELLVHFVRDEHEAGLPLPVPIRKIIED